MSLTLGSENNLAYAKNHSTFLNNLQSSRAGLHWIELVNIYRKNGSLTGVENVSGISHDYIFQWVFKFSQQFTSIVQGGMSMWNDWMKNFV